MSPKFVTKEDVLFYLKELAKEYRKLGGKHTPGEIIIVGGSSIMLNYLFDMKPKISTPIFLHHLPLNKLRTI